MGVPDGLPIRFSSLEWYDEPRRAVPVRDCLAPGGEPLARDDWKYHDDDEMEEEEEKKDLPPEKQCRHCLHWVQREAPSCVWCGKPFE